MTAKKEKLLNEAYERFLKVSMNELPPEQLDDLVTENIMGYGTTIDEKIISPEDCHDLVDRQKEQGAGLKFKREIVKCFRNVSPEEDSALFVDELKMTIQTPNETHKFLLRASTILEYADNKWRVVHFHTSKPDNTKGESDTWHIDEWKRKSEELQKIVNEKTADLLIKNRELEIEASLERVRAIALGMRKSEDLLNICETLFNELKTLGFDELRNTMINIHNDEEKTFLNYDYSDILGKTITPLYYNINPVIAKQVKQIRKSRDAFSETSFKGDELKKWKKFRKRRGEPDDPRIKNTNALYYYFYSIGTGSIGISTFGSISKEKLELLKRFRNVFEFSYRRHADVSKAEAQAKEAKLETSLERVRAQAMSIISSEQLSSISRIIFEELKSLGFSDLRNSEILINSDDKNTVQSYYYSDYGVTGVIEVDYTKHPRVKAWAEEMKKGSDAFASIIISENEIKKWRKYRESIGYLSDVKLNNAKIVYYSSYSIGPGALSISSFKPISEAQLKILERFKNVFGLAYRRYSDVALAEAQAREAKIEIALERVRSRTMAMQKSDELMETSKVMFMQFKELGINAEQISIAIINEEEQTVEVSATLHGDQLPKTVKVKINEHYTIRKIYEIWKTKEKSSTIVISGKQLKRYNIWRNKLMGRQMYTTVMKKDEQWIVNFAYFPKGVISLASDAYISEETIQLLERFAGVFELTYTRFLDLKLAEKQTHEAKIELSLERVRARSMAMHHSSELVDASIVLFNELKSLGIEAIRTGVGIVNSSDQTLEVWSSQLIEKERIKILGVIPVKIHPFFEGYYKSWKKKEPYFSYEIAGKDVKKYYNLMSSILSYPKMKEFNLKELFYTFFFPEGSLNVISKNKLSEEECSLVTRFAGAFGHIYRRFLDLQKAEGQAREAQIEAAIEKVRSKALAMHTSSDMISTAREIFDVLKELGLNPVRSGLSVVTDAKKKEWDAWSITEGEKEKIIPMSSRFTSKVHSVSEDIFKHWKRQDEYWQIEIAGDELKEFVKSMPRNYVPLNKNKSSLPTGIKWIFFHYFSFKEGVVFAGTAKPFTDEEISILKKFTRLFAFAYTRYLDLQKAENQAREAQIEVALERVRSRTMAMHKSDELAETAAVLFEQLCGLGIDALRLYIGIIDHKSDEIDFWTTDYGGSRISSKYKANLYGSTTFRKIYSGWKEKRKSLIVDPKGKELTEHLYYLKEIMNYPIRDRKTLSRRLQTIAYFSKGLIGVLSTDEMPKESVNLLERFAGVFDLTYRRFLDLQISEAQTREAQIEVALERVRSRTMAMQSSDELQEAAILLFHQIRDLGVNTGSCGYIIWGNEKKDATVWMSSPEGSIQESFKLSHSKSKIYKEIYTAKESGKDFFVKEVSGKELKNHFDYMTTVPGIGEIIKQLRKSRYKFPETIVYNIAFFKQGYLSFHTHKLSPEAHDIFRRFANVFEQTYTRFLDLQKAEAQAREAQIQLALERVRAKAMAMQKSDELLDVSLELYNQFKQLDNTVRGLTINIINEKERVFEISFGMFNQSFKLSIDEPIVMSKAYKCWKSGKKSLILELAREDLIKFNKIRNSAVGSEIFPLEYKSGFKLFMYMAFFSNGMLIVGMEERRTEETNDILQRFASVFDLTYTRFLDLKKAEAQARESQIEAALERVRSRTMGMQKSEELKDVIQVVYEQFVHLNINIEHTGFDLDYKTRDDHYIWLADKLGTPSQVTIPYFDCEYYNLFKEAKEKGKDFFAVNLTLKEKNRFYQKLFKHVPGLTEKTKEFLLNCPGLAASTVLLENVSLYIENFSGTPYTDEENNILMRFGKVFQQTYTRFLDLQKAETQAREAQIEAALERTRTQSMLMQHSSELDVTSRVFHEQLLLLGIASEISFVWLPDVEKEKHLFWTTWAETENDSISLKSKSVIYDLDKTEPYTAECFRAWKSGEPVHIYAVNASEVKSYFDTWGELVGDAKNLKPEFFPEGLYYAEAFMNYGCFGFIISRQLKEDEKKILIRFTIEFERTYTRFLDLQKAEAQAREAQIESALERVRGKAMAMHNSDDLTEAAGQVFTELNNLGIKPIRSGFVLLTKESRKAKLYPATSFDNKNIISFTGEIEFTGHPVYEKQYEVWDKKENYFPVLEGELLKSYYKILAKGLSVPYENFPTDKKQFGTFLTFSEGFLFTWSDEPYSEIEINILERFKSILDLTIRRYIDLKNAEAQAREAQIEAALEKVRGRAMSMHNSSDLSTTAILVFTELRKLGINSKRTGVDLLSKDSRYALLYAATTSKESDELALAGTVELSSHPCLEMQYESWLKKENYFPILSGEELKSYYEVLSSQLPVPSLTDEQIQNKQFGYYLPFSEGLLFAWSDREYSEYEINILNRFKTIIDLTFRRYLELQKAEQQARESQIEASLERVRSKAMAMQKSGDLGMAVTTIFEELDKLDLGILRCGIGIIKKENKSVDVWATAIADNKKTVQISGDESMDIHPLLRGAFDAWLRQEDFSYLLQGEDLINYYKSQIQSNFKLPDSQSILTEDDMYKQYYFVAIFQSGGLFAFRESEFPEEAKSVIKRFADVINFTYTRFNDLKQAEAQAREAQIEVALERVRSRTMAMHHSNELSETAAILFAQMKGLGIVPVRSYIGIIIDNTGEIEFWTTDETGNLLNERFAGKAGESETIAKMYTGWENKEKTLTIDQTGKELADYLSYLSNILNAPFSNEISHVHRVQNIAYFTKGLIGIATLELQPPETFNILERFAGVFDLTYRRFLDLSQAELQAREAKIEAALERVRAGSLIMRKPEDMFDVCKVISEQLILLNVNEIRNTQTVILNEGKETYQNYEYFPDYNEKTFSEIEYNLHPKVTEFVNEIKKSSEAFFTTSFEGKELQEWRDYRKNTNQIPDAKLDAAQSVHYYFYSIGPGALGISTYAQLSEEQINIFKRFRNVFELAYRRYIDIEMAEAQAREAKIEVALERVRSRTLAMQKSDELAETAAVVFKQLITLGIEPNRLYIGINKDGSEEIEFWITDEDGTRVSSQFTGNKNRNASIRKMYDGWKDQKKSLTIDMQGKELEDYFRHLSEELHVPFKHGLSQKRRVQSIAYFSHGFIGIASPEPQPEETIVLLERFAAVFNLTYARFNDLKIAEHQAEQARIDLIKLQTEKKRAEEALTELRATQTQLIQSEKMASLGELTAGIAHEIQNPLNFVNNFSEVNAELIDELNQEMDKGNFEEAAAIAKDIKENEQKIKHHGKRAEGIVKGMLQHSRNSSGQKEPVNINLLADEYLRLAYHGLRAKDKTFNAKMETDFDNDIGDINAAPQEIGRVILNLITNAFYAVTEKKKQKPKDYDPTVKLSTKKYDNKVLISVKDNGNGIPQKVMDKIFQPFFTTKPSGQGTGLGLSMSYDIIKAHNGELKVETKEGEGSEFVISLPFV